MHMLTSLQQEEIDKTLWQTVQAHPQHHYVIQCLRCSVEKREPVINPNGNSPFTDCTTSTKHIIKLTLPY